MPYINSKRRECLDDIVEQFPEDSMTAGDLNYVITRLITGWIRGWRRRHPLSYYAEIALAIGVLETVKLELYRRLVAPYEDTKRIQNGDIRDFEATDAELRHREG